MIHRWFVILKIKISNSNDSMLQRQKELWVLGMAVGME
jgi:hypothetical protein